MSNIRNLEKFNTHSMSKDVVLSVSTGRDLLIDNISKIIDENILHPKTIQHVILTGPRGMGKSFLLKYFQITSENRTEKSGTIDFVLLPEEQYNINTPSQFIDELLACTEKNTTQSIGAVWNKKDSNWESSLEKLKKRIEEKTNEHKKYLLIASVENFDVMIETIFPTNADQSKLRKFLTSTPNFMLLGSSKKNDIDKDYNKRLFFAFQKYSLTPWTEDDYTQYFNRRYNLLKQNQPDSFQKKDVNQLRNKLKAISKFTGGSPRMAVVLTNLLFDEDAVSTAQTLDSVVEDLSPYYQDLMEKMPQNSRILFDALIRSDENVSQSALAEQVGAKQSDISKAFKWLLENNFIVGIKIKGEKFYRYSIADRVFVLFYQKRFLLIGLECSYIKILSDFLISFYETKELGEYSLKYQNSNYIEGIEFAKLTFIKENIKLSSINWDDSGEIRAKLNDIINGKIKPSVSKTVLPKPAERTKKEIEKEIKDNLIEIKRYEKENNTDALLNELLLVAFNYQEVKQFEKSTKYFNKALEITQKGNGVYLQAMSLDQIGWNYNNIMQYGKSIEFHQKALTQYKKEDRILEQIWSLGQIGINYFKLDQFESSTKFYKKTLALLKKKKDVSEQAWCLGQIGLNFSSLNRFEESIEFHQKALTLNKKNRNITEQIWNLEQIGINYHDLGQLEKSTEFYERALIFNRKEGNIFRQAWCLGQIGINYYIQKQFERSFDFYKKALTLYKEDGDIPAQVLLYSIIGINCYNLKQFENAISFHKKALNLNKKMDQISIQGNNNVLIGVNYTELKQFNEAIKFYNKALLISKKENNVSLHALILGKLGSINLLIDEFEKAWKIVLQQVNTKVEPEEIIRQFGDAIVYKEKWEGKAEAFNIAIQILSSLSEISININKYSALKNIFANMLSMNLPYDLLEDICVEAKSMFGKAENIIIDATIHTIKYLEGEKDETYLKRINPDIAVAVKAIIEAAKL